MPKITLNGKMLQQSMQILKRLAVIVVMFQLLASARAGVIKKREIMTTTVIAPKETEILNKKKEEIETKLPIAKEVDAKWNDTKEATKNFQSDFIVKSQENEVETIATKLEKDNTSEADERASSMELRLEMKKGTAELTDSVKENDMSDDYMDFREESIELKGLEDLTTLAPETELSTLSNELFQNTESNLNSDSYGTTVPTSPDKSPVKSENSTASVSLEIDTTANVGIDPMVTTIGPNIAENLAIAMQNLKELQRSQNITQIQHKDDSDVLSNDIITPTARSGSEKKGKFINDNSTNQFNLLNTSEVRTLLSMKTIPVKPTVAAVPENHTLHEKFSDHLDDQGKNISAMSSGNSEKSLLDWTQIMMNENLSSTEGYQLQNISAIFDGTELLHQETKPFQRLSQAHTTVLPPADTNSIVALHENESSFSATTENNEIDVTTNLPTAKTTTTTIVSLYPSTTVAAPEMPSTGVVTATSVASATTSFPSPTLKPKQSPQPLKASPATTTSKSTDLLISTEFLSTTTKPTAFPLPSTSTAISISETTVLSSSFPPYDDDNENKAKQSDKIPNETTTQIGLSSATTTTTTTADLLSSDLSSPAPQETTDMPMENTTNKAITTTQATAIKSVLDTPKNVSTTINEASIASTTTVMEPMQSSTRQPPPPLPENNLIMNTHPPQTAYDNDNHDEVTVKTNHHNNENYDDDERRTTTNATQVVGEEATLELSSNSATTVSRSEASAESTTALAESSRNVTLTESTTTIASRTITTATPKTTTTTLELTTLTPNDVTLRENENSHSTPPPLFDSQIVTTTDVDLDATFTTEATTESSFPTSSSTLAAILYVNKDVKSTKTPFVYAEEEKQDFSRATTTTTSTAANPTPAAVLHKTTTESLSNFVEQTTPAPTLTSTSTSTASASVKPNEEDPTVFQNHSIPTDAKQVPSLMPNNSIDMNLIDQPEHSEKLDANKFKIPVVTEVVNVEELTSTTITPSQSTTSDIRSSTTERLLISLLDDSTPTTITSSSTPTASHEVYEVIATTEVVTKNPAATTTTSSTTTAVNEPTVAPPDTQTSTLDTRMIAAATSLPTTMLPTITLEPDNVAISGTGIGGPHSQPDPVDSPEMDVNVIIAISISVIGIIALILLVAFLYVVRKRQKQMSYGHRCRPVSLDAYSMDNVSVYNSVRRKSAMRSSKRSYGNVAFDDPSLTHNVLTAVELGKFMDKRSNIFEEFKYVPQIIARPDEVPAGCEDKNRYANVIPIPETRVPLQRQNDDEKSEYINANYVRGPRDSPNYYIACQAPLESTVADFWRMIWEQKSRVIIQATDLVENGIEKCAEYLPPSVTLDNHTTYLDFQVTLKHREVKDKYAISTLILKNTLVNASRELTHYWYKWPETGVPAEEAPIIAMLLEARCSLKTYAIEEANELKATAMSKSTTITTLKTDNSRETSSATSPDNQSVNESNGTADNRNSNSNSELNTMTANEKNSKNAANNQGPLTVHCSPGTGRTGTIIGCDIGIRSLETPKRNVDIPQIIYYVRRGRASAVQTKEQYEFIYKVANMYASKITNVSNET